MEPKVADFDIVIRDGLNVERHFQVWESTRPSSRLNQIQLPGGDAVGLDSQAPPAYNS